MFNGDLKISQTSQALAALNNIAGTRTVEIDLPILQTKATVRPVTGSEELKLRTLRASGATFVSSFTELLFEHTSFSDVKFNNVLDFQQHLTPPDKALLVYALLEATFSKLPEKIVNCPSCKTPITFAPAPSAMLHEDTITRTFTGDDFTAPLLIKEIIPGVIIHYGFPTEFERIQVLEAKSNEQMRNSIEENNDVLSALELFCIYIKKIEIKSGEETITLTDKINEIFPTVRGMPLDIQAALLEDETIGELIEYNPNFYLKVHCENPACEKPDFNWNAISPEQDFFRKTLSIYN